MSPNHSLGTINTFPPRRWYGTTRHSAVDKYNHRRITSKHQSNRLNTVNPLTPNVAIWVQL